MQSSILGDMKFEMPSVEQPVAPENPTEKTQPTENVAEKPIDESLVRASKQFLGDEIDLLSRETIDETLAKAVVHKNQLRNTLAIESPNKSVVQYDKYKKSFFIDETKATMGEIIASRHLGIDVALPQSLLSSGEGKRLYKNYIDRASADFLCDELNRELAHTLSQTVRRQDVLKSKAYSEIAKRSGTENSKESKQMGVLAEKVIIGFAETIAIDRPDLGLSVIPGNAFQDVEHKIDFILETVHKKRGVGVESENLDEEHKAIGIQFTINTSKAIHKAEQIAKAKEKGIAVDDILYVAIDQSVLGAAVREWEKASKPIVGPWHYLPKEVKHKAVSELFDSVLTEEQKTGLLAKIT